MTNRANFLKRLINALFDILDKGNIDEYLVILPEINLLKQRLEVIIEKSHYNATTN